MGPVAVRNPSGRARESPRSTPFPSQAVRPHVPPLHWGAAGSPDPPSCQPLAEQRGGGGLRSEAREPRAARGRRDLRDLRGPSALSRSSLLLPRSSPLLVPHLLFPPFPHLLPLSSPPATPPFPGPIHSRHMIKCDGRGSVSTGDPSVNRTRSLPGEGDSWSESEHTPQECRRVRGREALRERTVKGWWSGRDAPVPGARRGRL